MKIFKLYSKDDLLNYGSLRKYVDDINLELIQSRNQLIKIITDYASRENIDETENLQKPLNLISNTINFEMFYEFYYKYECWKYEDFRKEAFKQRREMMLTKSRKSQIKTKFREPTISSQLRYSVCIPPGVLEQKIRLPKESESSKKLQRYSIADKKKGFKKGTRSMKDLAAEMNKFKITTHEVESVKFVPPMVDLKKKSSSNLVIPNNPFLKMSGLSNVSEVTSVLDLSRGNDSVIDEEKTCRDDSVDSVDKTSSGRSIRINLENIDKDLNDIRDEIYMPKSSRNLNKSLNALNFNDISGLLINFGRSFVKTHRSEKSSSDNIESSDKSSELNTERLINKIQDHLQKTNN